MKSTRIIHPYLLLALDFYYLELICVNSDIPSPMDVVESKPACSDQINTIENSRFELVE